VFANGKPFLLRLTFEG